MVFQNYALYPHMTVADNMGFSLKLRGARADEISNGVKRAAEILASTPLLERYPRQLSGGQRQRVAMGRAIVRDPQVFLFDEPLSNLDAKLRVARRSEIKELHQRLKATTVYVTHDQIEAMTMADKIVVMHDGVVEQMGTPLELYDSPANQFVAGFIGSPAMNFLKGQVKSNGSAGFEGPNGVKLPLASAPANSEGRPAVYGVRPEHFTIADDGAEAELVVGRWKRFVPAEDDAFNAMVAAFKTATGTEMNVFSESFEDVQPKASVAANTGSGLDMAWGLHTLPQLFPTKVLKMNDVADYLGKKYGGWTDAAAKTCKLGNDWLGIPVATVGGYMTYRKSATDKAGFKEFPKDFPGFLAMCQALKKNNTPAGFALGHATGDANGWLHWVLWGHGAYTVDKDDKVIINSPETLKALEYCKALSENFIPGVASWNDSSNNKAFLSGELYCTSNGISIYVAAKDDPTKKNLADDT